MYAVIETGGKQYRVEVGTELEVELLDVEPGQAITLDRVLLVADGAEAAVGQPVVADAAVEAEVVGRQRGEKVIAFKYRPKARRRVKKGHRQELTLLRIADIRFNGKSAAEARRRADEDAKTERQRVEAAAAKQAAADAALAASLSKKAESQAAPKRGRAKAAGEAEPAKTAAVAPKRTRAKAADAADPAAASDASDSGESGEKPAPKRSRTKKDE